MRIALRSSEPPGVAIRIEPARATPVDWERWRDAMLGGAPTAPVAEEFTVPEGWSVTIVEVPAGDQVRVHAFYAVFDLAVHAWAAVAASYAPAVRAIFRAAVPVWDDDIVALRDL